VATRNQISRLAARIEGLADANAPRQASISVINIPTEWTRSGSLQSTGSDGQ
jgi:hypothetical protein